MGLRVGVEVKQRCCYSSQAATVFVRGKYTPTIRSSFTELLAGTPSFACLPKRGRTKQPVEKAPHCKTRCSCREAAEAAAPSSWRSTAAVAVGLLSSMLVSIPTGWAAAYTLAEVTPTLAPTGDLVKRERDIISIFERNEVSVANIVDITLQTGPSISPQGVEAAEGNGTGFVWDTEGHVVTNYHVLANVLKGLGSTPRAGVKVAKVTLIVSDGSQQTFDATLVGVDRTKDLAVVKVKAQQADLRPISVGASDALKVGQQVLAIGNPFGFDRTLTTGVISGVGRGIQSRAGVLIGGGIQTDAAINPGNSGGPLINSRGEVIGVNTAIFTSSGTSAGVGFAIPIDTVKRVVPQLIQYGKVVQPALNVQIAPDQVARALKVSRGALIQNVAPNSEAAKAGLLPTRRSLGGIVAGDVIVDVDGRRISNAADLQNVLESYAIGEQVTLKVKRGVGLAQEEELSVSVRLEEQIAT